ncbi:MAG: glutamate synthase large subunit [Actinomycetia bacterium]|nr:glutamate synthase large subunit [Actinomycetes bacterium]
MREFPLPQGLYDPQFEHDACGVSFVADLKGRPSHSIVEQALVALRCLQHRGATNAEPNTGDGAGLMVQVPDLLFRSLIDGLPPAGSYATGMAFLPPEPSACEKAKEAINRIVESEGLQVIGWRTVPTDPSSLGRQALDVMPSFEQVFIASPGPERGALALKGLDLDRKVYVVRKRAEHELPAELGSAVYFSSLSSRTFVYKGMLTTPQLVSFFPELEDERLESALALVHSRFSTNTFPSWPLAHPYRFLAHNGEINTVMGNRNWMRARESILSAPHWDGAEQKIFPICTPGASDTASLDEALELLHLGGYPLHHAVLMMIPEAWEKHPDLPQDQRDFYDFYASAMEPWDGPASVTFTDGTVVGAVLDRNGLRPSRYWVTDDDLVIMASEVGVIEVDPSKVVKKGRLEPGKMFLVDTSQGRIIDDDEIMSTLAAEHPYGQWLSGRRKLDELPPVTIDPAASPDPDALQAEQVTNGFTLEELEWLVDPMVHDGKEAIGSMGTDTPLAVLSNRPRMLFDYFFQLFAQVTNPPLDALREELVTSHRAIVGPEANILEPSPAWCHQLELDYPVLTEKQLHRIESANADGQLPAFATIALLGLYDVDRGEEGLVEALDQLESDAVRAIKDGANLVVLSTRGATSNRAPIPSLLLTGAIHHHLVREKLRTQVGIIVESADAREVHHFALLLGCGADAVCPSLTFETIRHRLAETDSLLDVATAEGNYIKAASNGVIKVMSKMGISTVASYTGAQIFEAVGLSQRLVDEFFTGITSKLGGIGLAELAEECAVRHRRGFPDRPEQLAHRGLELGGEYQWRRDGEYHLFNPQTIFKLQHATRTKRYEIFKEYTNLVDDQAEQLATLRGLFRFDSDRAPIPIDEVEPASEIVKRFATGAMSYGSISAEAHETLAIAMNRLGAKSNTGEGGEDPERFEPMANGDSKRSAIKQVASGRFGVTSEYLTASDDIQIKMAQGAKPGEGGQLPGRKVYPWVAKTRHSTTGVGLISPPPHHDIYSIEDLAQLIHDLKNSNPSARIHVKLVAEVGVGTVAAGVSKAKADVVLISGNDGGTGASPLTSLKHAGGPWELGLAETQQTLLLNDLRDRIVVQVDGQIKTGRDVVVAAMLGAEEFGFATAPLVASGCVMMRVCHLDTCPVGIATQNPVLRDRFSGKPEFVVTYFQYIAQEVREYLAELGFRTLDEAIGRVEYLDTAKAIDHWKASGLDLTPILHLPETDAGAARHCIDSQDHGLEAALDQRLIVEAAPALNDGTPVSIHSPIENTNRTVGTMLGHELTKRYGGDGLPDDTIQIDFTGSAGQSFGAFVPRGITLRLEGDANDYFGKGLSGGHLRLYPSPSSPFVAEENIIAGNVILYGATSGTAHIRGVVGERFCVRNSGAEAVVEGVGDHGCEYMTGGVAVVLGPTGRNFGAGMSGGVAYVLDEDRTFPQRVNPEMVELEDLGADDDARLHLLVTRHLEETGSAVAKRLLADWSMSLNMFVKIMPTDYRRVLEAQQRAADEGTDPVAAMMEAAHG